MNRSLVFSFFGRDVSAGRSMTRLAGTAQMTEGRLSRLGGVLAGAAKAGALAFGAAAVYAGTQILKVGMAYQDSLNTFQAVSHASKAQMAAVGDEAKRLGANMSLPATSAADAAAAMTELAKGGLNVKQSMHAALGTLRLSAAAQVDGAQAAQIEANALNQFGLKGKYAAHVADDLANTANAASGEITDMASALSYVGPVARSTGIGLDDTATAIGLLAKNGILGSMAGTSLRGMLTSMASPSKKAAGALKALGVIAYDSKGNFVGLRKITDELAAARGRLTTKAFAGATADAFQKRNLSAVNILAQSGVRAWDHMSGAVTRAGGAQQVAAAKMKGLHGALQGLQSQLETVAISIYQKVAPGLERVVRTIATKGVPAVQAFATHWGKKLWPILVVVGRYVTGVLVPAWLKLAKSISGTVISAFRYLIGAIRPNIDGLKTIGTVLLTLAKVTLIVFATSFKVQFLILSRVIGAAIVLVGWLGKAFHALAGFFSGPFIRAVGTVASLFVRAIKAMVDTGLSVIGTFVHGAAAAFGWLPFGIGGKLKDAASQFDVFRSAVDSKLSALATDAGNIGHDIGTNVGVGIFNALTAALAQVPAALGIHPSRSSNVDQSDRPVIHPGNTPTQGAHARRHARHHRAPATTPIIAPLSSGSGSYTPSDGSKSKAKKTGAGSLTQLTAHQAKLLAKGVLDGFHGASQHVLSRLTYGLQDEFNGAATRIEHGLQRWTDRVKTARDKMLADIKARKSMAAQIRDALVGGSDLTGAFTQDAAGNTILGNVGTYLAGKLAELKTFVADLRNLRKAGLGAALINMVAAAGPTQGIQLADQLLSGAAGSIASLNATEAGIGAAGLQAGNIVAHATLDSKVEADRKVLREQLHEQRKANRLIEKLCRALGDGAKSTDDIARDLRKLKRHLGHDLGLA